MLDLRHCTLHSLPIDIICKQHQTFIAVCMHCFSDRHTESTPLVGIRLSPTTLELFSSFTTFVQTKLQEWLTSVSMSESDTVFEQSSLRGSNGVMMADRAAMKRIALEVIESYTNLIRTNKQCVGPSPNSQLLYHPEFMKDIYSLIIDNWQVSANAILNNFTTRIRKELSIVPQGQFRIKEFFIDEMNLQKMVRVSKVEEQILVTLPAHTLNSHSSVTQSISDNNVKNKQQNQPKQKFPPETFMIKRIQSLIQIKDKLESVKQIEVEQNIDRLKNKPKKSKIIDESDYNQWQGKFQNNLLETQRLRKQNDQLKRQNKSLSNQKINMQQDHEMLRRKYEKKLGQSRERYTSGKKQNENMDPNSQLLLAIVQLQVQVNNSKHDISILIDLVNECLKQPSLEQQTFQQLNSRLLQLRTLQFQH